MKKLSKKEREIIVSCLLGFASADICFDDVEPKALLKIAKKMGIKKVKTAYLFGTDYLDDEKMAKEIQDNFKIKVNS